MLSLKKKTNTSERKALVDQEELEDFLAALEQLAGGDYVLTLKKYNDPLLAQGAAWLEDVATNVTNTYQEFVLRITRLVSFLINIDYNQMRIVAEKSKQQTESTEMVAATSEEMLASVSEVMEKMQVVAEQAQTASNNAQSSTDQVEQSTAQLQQAAERFQALTVKINELMNGMKDVKDVIEFIKNVAGQTNLLALNAAIEAARAGEAGRGFAVVAEEVRKLSINTSTSVEQITANMERLDAEFTKMVEELNLVAKQIKDSMEKVSQINQLIEGIKHSVLNLTENFDQVATITEEQSTAMQNIAEATNQVAEIASHNSSRITTIGNDIYELGSFAETLRNDLLKNHFSLSNKHTLELAKTDHLLWKWRIYNMFKGLEHIEPEKVASHFDCRLGKWYYGDAQRVYKDSNIFVQIERPHQAVHQAAKAAAEAYNRGDLEQAKAALEDLEKASEEVIKLLDQLIAKE